MMNAQHSLSGACLWLAAIDLGTAVGMVAVSPTAALYLATVSAGAAVVPDQDIPGSAPSRTFGPISMNLARFLAVIGARIQQATRTNRDYIDHDGHRTITHNVWAALSMGAVIGTVCTLVGDRAVVFTGFVFTAYALRALFGRYGTARGVRSMLNGIGEVGHYLTPRKMKWRKTWRTLGRWARRCAWLTTTAVALTIALSGAALAPAGGLGQLGPWLGVAVAVGMFCHCLGDCPSVLGCPLWAPIMIEGRRWYRVRWTFGTDENGKPRRGFRVGGPFERWVLRPTFIVLVVIFVVLLAGPVRDGLAAGISEWTTSVWTATTQPRG